jgi:putative FmdB family regulatory protein
MPTYEYACRNCGRSFEVAQSFTDPPLTICDECGGELRKIYSAPAIAFKGPGFYATDHGKKTPVAAKEKEGPSSETKPGTKEEARKDTPAPKKEEAS